MLHLFESFWKGPGRFSTMFYFTFGCKQWCRNPGEMGGYIPPNNLAVSPQHENGSLLHPPNNLKECTAEPKFGEKVFFSCWRPFFVCFFCFGLHLKSGRKSVLFLEKTFSFFFGLHLYSGRKSVLFALFFWSSQNFHTCTKSWSRFIPLMLKIGQNWIKLQIIPSQCSTKIGTTGCKCRHIAKNKLINYQLDQNTI